MVEVDKKMHLCYNEAVIFYIIQYSRYRADDWFYGFLYLSERKVLLL